MRPELIGLTTDLAQIANILGVKSADEYSLYEETKLGKFYARILPDGTYDDKVVLLVSSDQADKLESTKITPMK